MRYLIIGGAGFIGSHIVDSLLRKGHSVTVLDNLVSGVRAFVPPQAKFIWGDIRSKEDLDRVGRKEEKFDRVINLAAQPYIPNCYDDPELFFETNANGTLNVLRFCEKYGVGRVLQYASAEEYGTQKGKIDESVAVHPQSTYGVSKVAADYLCSVRHRESGLHAVALRAFNHYGPRETHEYVIPEIISQLDALRSPDGSIPRMAVLRMGNVKAERDFLYVEDGAEYAIELLEKGAPGEIYNLGAGDCISIEELARTIARACGFDDVSFEVDPAKLRPWDIERLQSDNTKIHGVVEYRPKTSFVEGLQNTIAYFIDNGRQWHF